MNPTGPQVQGPEWCCGAHLVLRRMDRVGQFGTGITQLLTATQTHSFFILCNKGTIFGRVPM